MHCKKPIRIKNPYTDDYMFVPCGKCEGCLIERSNNLSRRVTTEISNHPYNIFFTLTYDNEHLPYLELKDGVCESITNVCSVRFDPLTHKKYIEYNSVPLDVCFDILPDYQPTGMKKKCVGVLYKPHIQKFMRSLRDSLTLYYGKRKKFFTYFVVGEYGTKYRRPHYHGIFHVDSWEIADHIKKLIPETWLFCSHDRIESKYLDGEKFGYLSSYISGRRDSDGVLSTRLFREFHLYSRTPLYGVSQTEDEILQGLYNRADSEVFRRVCGDKPNDTSVLTLSKSVLRSYFPRFRGIDNLDDSLLFSIIRENKRDYEYYQRIYLACKRFIKRYVIDFESEDDGMFNRLAKLFGSDKYESNKDFVLSSSHIWLYIRVYRRVYSALSSYLIRNINEDIFKKVNFDSIVTFYHEHYNTHQYGLDIIDYKTFVLIRHYLLQFDIHLGDKMLEFIARVRGLLPESYYNRVDEYISKYKAMLAPKHTSNYLNNF